MKTNWPDDYINKVICGDCLQVMKDIPDNSVDLVLTDPPYGITQNDWDAIPDLTMFWLRICCITDVLVSISSQPFTTDLINSNREWFKYEWIWKKTASSGFLNSKIRPLKQHENILMFARGKTIYNPQGLIEGKFNNSRSVKSRKVTKGDNSYGQQRDHSYSKYRNYPKSVIEIPNPKNNLYHNTQKPVELMKYLIATYSNEDDIILDCFAGSGSTLVAAKQLGRRFIGIEISPKYCEIARQRLSQEVMKL